MPLHKARLKISDYSRQRKAGVRARERRLHMVTLSLTSMVDMFAILVIFLLTNSTTVSDWMHVEHGIDLPKAKHVETPKRAPTLQISKAAIYAEDRELFTVEQLLANDTTPQNLIDWLKAQPAGSHLNLIGHTSLPFSAIKRLVTACQNAGFSQVNLAVEPIAATL